MSPLAVRLHAALNSDTDTGLNHASRHGAGSADGAANGLSGEYFAGDTGARALAHDAAHHWSDAAVLIAITDRAAPGIILTTRPATMKHHAGQVALPGGRRDPGDADACATALREAREEVGLPPDRATLVGSLSPYHTLTGFRVTPVVAVIPPDLSLRANPGEVADWFEVPVDYLREKRNWRLRTAEYQGARRAYHEIHWQDRRIWGATAAILRALGSRLDGVSTDSN